MQRKLEMDDIRVGMYITVLKGKIEQRVYPGPDGPQIMNREKDRLNGKVLEVVSVDMPYIVVLIHERLGSRPQDLDLRTIEVMRLSPYYVCNLVPKLKLTLNKDTFWDEINDEYLEQSDVDIEAIFKDL